MKQMKSDLGTNKPADTYFALGGADLRRARDQRPYLAVVLADKTGQINGYIWDDPEGIADRLREATYVHVQGNTKMHNGKLILSIEYIQPAAEEEIDIHDFLEVVPGGVDLWMSRLHEQTELITDRNCRALVDSFLADAHFHEDFRHAPAAITVHHNYVGGLVEHSVNTMSHAVHMSEKYPSLLDRDLLLTGSLLHDVGKTKEINGGISRSYSTEGKLHGHIALGFLMLHEKIGALKGFPSEIGLLLKHMILSHHGSLEFGSPVKPATAEALALHHIENLDAKLNHLYGHFKDTTPDDTWSQYDRFLGSEICRMKFKKNLMPTYTEEALTGGL